MRNFRFQSFIPKYYNLITINELTSYTKILTFFTNLNQIKKEKDCKDKRIKVEKERFE